MAVPAIPLLALLGSIVDHCHYSMFSRLPLMLGIVARYSDIDAVKLSSVSVTTLLLLAGEDDFRDVRSTVADLAGRWKDLGISLGIPLIDLDNIRFLTPCDCLSEVVALWLKQCYNVRTTLVLWSPHFLMLGGMFLQL